MPQEIQSFYRNVQEICVKDNVPELISYLSTDGLLLLRQLLKTELDVITQDELGGGADDDVFLSRLDTEQASRMRRTRSSSSRTHSRVLFTRVR